MQWWCIAWPWRVEEHERPTGELQRHPVRGLEHAIGADMNERAVGALHLLRAVDRGRASHEARRIDQVAGAARMRDQPGPGQLLHQQADAAGMVEVHVGGDHHLDRLRCQAGGVERGQEARHRVVGAGVDEGGTPFLDDQEGGVEAGAMKAGVDDVDAVIENVDEGRTCNS
jgi:hypothetical protein